MASVANLVHETSTSTGTGNFTVSSENGKQTFANAFSTGGTDVFEYFISNRSAAEWERGTGHMSDATTLVRDTVLESTNADAAVNFSAGTKDVTNDVPAGLQIFSPDNESAAQGDVLYHNGSAWKRLAAGTDGQFLQSQGAAANPQWAGATPAWTYAGEVTVQSGTAVTLASSIPAGVTEIEIFLRDISMDTNNNLPKIQIGDSGGFETTGYTSAGAFSSTTRTDTSGFALDEGTGSDSNTSLHGTVVLRDYDGNGTNWHLHGNTFVSGGSDRVFPVSGWKNLSAVLTQVRIALETGDFDTSTSSGVASVRYR